MSQAARSRAQAVGELGGHEGRRPRRPTHRARDPRGLPRDRRARLLRFPTNGRSRHRPPALAPLRCSDCVVAKRPTTSPSPPGHGRHPLGCDRSKPRRPALAPASASAARPAPQPVAPAQGSAREERVRAAPRMPAEGWWHLAAEARTAGRRRSRRHGLRGARTGPRARACRRGLPRRPAAPRRRAPPRCTSNGPTCVSDTLYPPGVRIVTVSPCVGTWPANVTSPPDGARTTCAPPRATSMPRCCPPAYGSSPSEKPRSTSPSAGHDHALAAGAVVSAQPSARTTAARARVARCGNTRRR